MSLNHLLLNKELNIETLSISSNKATLADVAITSPFTIDGVPYSGGPGATGDSNLSNPAQGLVVLTQGNLNVNSTSQVVYSQASSVRSDNVWTVHVMWEINLSSAVPNSNVKTQFLIPINNIGFPPGFNYVVGSITCGGAKLAAENLTMSPTFGLRPTVTSVNGSGLVQIEQEISAIPGSASPWTNGIYCATYQFHVAPA
jgi:hypothetical protein